ncbi:MAG: TlpA disulfide reductase family protein [Candidatus Velthaea sp.]
MNRFASAAALALAVSAPLGASAAPTVGAPAPAFTLPTVGGKPLALAALKGRAVYLNFYASWCGPCNEEAPSIGKLSAKYKAKGLTVVGVNELENPQKAKSFMQHYKLPYDAVLDSDGKVGKDYNALGLPVHVFIDRKGIVKTYRLGEMSSQDIETSIKGVL